MSETNNKLMYLVLTNISKRKNVSSLLLTAAAFGCSAVFIVGQPSFNIDVDSDACDVPRQIRQHIRKGNMNIIRFADWKGCVSHLRIQNIKLVGVEIHSDARNIETFFDSKTPIAFLMGNEGQGIIKKHMDSCDGFVRIPQYGSGTASLNVNVAASIILQRYHQSLVDKNLMN